MPTPKRKALFQNLEVLMCQALQSDFGIEVKTNSPDRLRSELNFARKAAREAGDNNYDCLTFRTCPTDPESYLWIIKKISVEES